MVKDKSKIVSGNMTIAYMRGTFFLLWGHDRVEEATLELRPIY